MLNFFEQQDRARRRTGLLLVFFVLAVLGVIAGVYAAVAVVFTFTQHEPGPEKLLRLWNPELLAATAVCTSALVAGGSLYKVSQLAGGGHVVAQTLGGRLISSETTDPHERRLLNVVAEMAIAASVPVPPVYVLANERGINAFAAGYTPGDAVIGVTSGCVQALSRDELQGVVAHEFSHILSGDMRLNIRLMAWVHGILLISLLGYILMRSGSSNSKNKNMLPLLGLLFYIIGYVGVFFGHLIKSAVSRQREFLADAAAVQFTRNPVGLASALKKIGGLSRGSLMQTPQAEQASHMFFANGLRASWFQLFATHPPLTERIRRLDPDFAGAFPEVAVDAASGLPASDEVAVAELAPSGQGDKVVPAELVAVQADAFESRQSKPHTVRYPFAAAESVAGVGAPVARHQAHARAVLNALPVPLINELRDPLGAYGVVCALLLDANPAIRMRQLAALEQGAPTEIVAATQRAVQLLSGVSREAWLPIVDLALPALRKLSPAQYADFVRRLRALVQADQAISTFEYLVHRVLLRHLDSAFNPQRRDAVKFHSLRPLTGACAQLLSTVAHAGNADPAAARAAFQAGSTALGLLLSPDDFLPASACGWEQLDRVLRQIAAASPPLKQRILDALAACIGNDGQVTLDEAELLRALSDALGCPMPSLLASLPNLIAGPDAAATR